MEVLLSELVDVLEREAGVLDQLLSAATDKQMALLSSSASAVPEIARREESLVAGMAGLERRRSELSAGLGALMGVSGDSLTLSSIIAATRGETAGELRKLQTLLVARSHRLDEVNRENALLLAQSIDLAQAWLSAISGEVPSRTYGPSGRVNNPHVGISAVSARL